MKPSLTLSMLFIISAHCFSQCDSAFFRRTASAVYDVSLISNKIIVGVGSNGYIIKSTDGGNSWHNIPNSYGSFTLKTVEFVNDSTGYATGDGGIIKTEDQGETWYPLLFPVDPNFGSTYYDMHFFNKDSGIFTGKYGHVLTTADGGRSFKDTTIGGSNIYTIDFINDSTGLMGSTDMYKTTDGGKNWRKINIDNLGIADIKKIRFVTPSFVVASGSNNVFASSSDGGETWTPATPNPNVYPINDFYFFDENNGVAMGTGVYSSLLLHTTDGGRTFTINTDDPQGNSLFSFNTDPLKNKLMAVGGSSINAESNARNIISSSDNGNTWTVQSNNTEIQYYYTQFVNDSTGFISGADDYFYRTTDYGESWKKLGLAVTGFANPAKIFYFTDSQHGYAVTEAISYTADGGKSWVVKSLPGGIYGDAPQYMVFLDSLRGAAAFRSDVYYTDDGARSWQPSQTPPGSNGVSYVTGMVRTPGGKLFTAGEYGNVMQSADSGKTWTSIKLNNDYLTGIYFYNDLAGFIGTSDNIMYKTINGGLTWDSITVDVYNVPIRSFAFSDSLHGFMLTNKGQNYLSGFYYTEDGGNTWKAVYGGGGEIIYNLSGFTNIYAAGGDGVILKTDHAIKPSIPGYIYGKTQVCDSSVSVYKIAGGNDLTYTWSVMPQTLQQTGTTSDTIEWKGGGQYTIAVAASNVCGTGVARTQAINVVDFKPEITVHDSVLTVTKGQAYSWYLNDTLTKTGTTDSDAVLVAHKTGIYKAAVIDSLGCTGFTDTVSYYLPFRLVSFTGMLSSDKLVNLQWIVANESSGLYEVIERGSDSVHFAPIDSLPARNAGNASDVYTFTDQQPAPGLNFYRLKFTQADGTVTYSGAVMVKVNAGIAPVTYPNPATNLVTISKGEENIDAMIIYNSQGVALITKSYSSGQTSVTLDVSMLKHGLYFIKIKTSKNTYTQQLAILR